ncbi:hypothetical protein R1flu_001717 [Riccia fluitans]|uniref:Uncharacterized protein n=1 Tax=Riccia fluitans TaxID=41844 RepID=A0ABD1Y7E0_9MARC
MKVGEGCKVTYCHFGVFFDHTAMIWYLEGFMYYSSLKARKRIVQLLVTIVSQQEQEMAERQMSNRAKVYVLTSLFAVPDEKGELKSSIKDNLILFLFACYDTNSNLLAMIISVITKRLHVYKQLVQEHTSIMERKHESDDRGTGALTMDHLFAMKYSWIVTQEALRLQLPAATIFSEATTDIEYNGYLTQGLDANVEQSAFALQPESFPGPINISSFEESCCFRRHYCT